MLKCMVPDCPSKTIHLRMLCRSCYNYAARLVALDLSTWEKLEKEGKVGTTHQPKTTSRFERSKWFGIDPLELYEREAEYRKANKSQ